MNVEDGTMTSSPAPIPNASSARWRPAVPEPTPTADAGSHRRFKFAQLRSKAQARRSQHRDDSVDVSIRDVQRRERYANGGHDAATEVKGMARLISSSWASGHVVSTSTIRSVAWPSPYGFVIPTSDARNAALRASAMRARIDAAFGSASRTLRARSRPFWRAPTFTVGNANDAVSMIPLEELPTMASTHRSRLQYVMASRLTNIFAAV